MPRISKSLLQFRLRTLLLAMALVAVWISLRMYRVRMTPENIGGVRQLATIDRDIFRIVWSADGRRAAFVEFGKPVEIRDARNFSVLSTVSGQLVAFAFSPDCDIVACATNSKTAEIRNLRTGSTIKLDTKNEQPDVEFSPDGKILATGGYGNAARLWRVSDGQLLDQLNIGPATGGLQCIFTPDGKTLAVGNRNSTTFLFDIASGAVLHELPQASSQELRFDPSGQKLAVAYVDGSVGLWDVATGTRIATHSTGAKEIYTLDWSSDGKMLAVAGLEGRILILDGSDLRELNRLDGPDWVVNIRFSPDGTQLLSAGGQQRIGGTRWIQLWRTAPDATEIVLTAVFWLLAAALVSLAALSFIRTRNARPIATNSGGSVPGAQ